MTADRDVVDVLVDDHRLIDGLLSKVASGVESDRLDDRRLSIAIAELARHIVVEEEYLYPLVGEVVPGGARMAADGVSLSGETEVLIKRLEASAPSSPERDQQVADLVRVVVRHIRMTEHDVFPALRQVCAPDQLQHLAGVVEMAKRTAPTRAHPGAPHRTALNQILSPGIGLVDRIRDAVTGRPTKPEQL